MESNLTAEGSTPSLISGAATALVARTTNARAAFVLPCHCQEGFNHEIRHIARGDLASS